MSKVKLSFAFLLAFLLVGMFSASAFAAPFVPNNPTMDHPDLTNGPADNGVENANQTGVGFPLKNDDGQMKDDKTTAGAHKLHGNFQNNTNSCASCHQTHTAAGDSLLFKNGAYNTCTACHDGTLGFYNVFDNGNANDNGAGTFGGSHDGNMSVHMSTGALEIGAAPGSNASLISGASWTSDFTCASCHDPHGSYSSRLLKNNPNGMASVARTVVMAVGADGVTVPSTVYGNELNDVAVAAAPFSSDKNLVKDVFLNDYFMKDITIAATDIDQSTDFYYKTGLKAGDRVLQLQRYIGEVWKNSPGVQVHYQGTNRTAYWPELYNGGTKVFPTGTAAADEATATAGTYWFNQAKAFYKVPTGATITKASKIDKAYTVELYEVTTDKVGNPIAVVAGVQPTRTVNGWLTQKGKGQQFNEWCGTCHVDYYTKTKENTGTEENVWHHTMSDNYNCARCHYAHGTDATIMQDAAGRTYEYLQTAAGGSFTPAEAKTYLTDVNNSSALKRYTNMAVCYGCHTSSHAEEVINSKSMGGEEAINGFVTPASGTNWEILGKKLLPASMRP